MENEPNWSMRLRSKRRIVTTSDGWGTIVARIENGIGGIEADFLLFIVGLPCGHLSAG